MVVMCVAMMSGEWLVHEKRRRKNALPTHLPGGEPSMEKPWCARACTFPPSGSASTFIIMPPDLAVPPPSPPPDLWPVGGRPSPLSCLFVPFPSSPHCMTGTWQLAGSWLISWGLPDGRNRQHCPTYHLPGQWGNVCHGGLCCMHCMPCVLLPLSRLYPTLRAPLHGEAFAHPHVEACLALHPGTPASTTPLGCRRESQTLPSLNSHLHREEGEAGFHSFHQGGTWFILNLEGTEMLSL